MSTDHSGSSTSRASAPRRSARQGDALDLLSIVGEAGATWHDFAEWADIHHGAASSALSVLHRTGKIARLTETRGRSHIYVLPEFAGERETQPYGGRAVERDLALRMVQAVRGIHNRYGPGETFCTEDGKPWPCATARAVGLT